MSNTQVLFTRDWALTIGLPGQQGKRYTGLRVVFDIDKTGVGSSNKSKIEVYNLSTLSRQTYQQADAASLKNVYQLQLQAGYAGNSRTIYLGDIRTAKNRRTTDGIVTTFECGSGEKLLTNSRLDRTYPPGTKFVTILQDLAHALEADIGSVLGIQDQTYNSGVHINGAVRTSLDKLLSKQRLSWSIQDGRLQIYPIGHHNGATAVVVSNQTIPSRGVVVTGLIGVPSQNQGVTQFVSLLNPSIMPGCPVQVYSETINGDFFRVNRAHFEGDSHAEKWQVTCECTPIRAQQTLPQALGNDFSKAVIA